MYQLPFGYHNQHDKRKSSKPPGCLRPGGPYARGGSGRNVSPDSHFRRTPYTPILNTHPDLTHHMDLEGVQVPPFGACKLNLTTSDRVAPVIHASLNTTPHSAAPNGGGPTETRLEGGRPSSSSAARAAPQAGTGIVVHVPIGGAAGLRAKGGEVATHEGAEGGQAGAGKG